MTKKESDVGEGLVRSLEKVRGMRGEAPRGEGAAPEGEGLTWDAYAAERKSLLRKIERLEDEAYDNRIIMRQALEMRTNLTGLDPSVLHRAVSGALRGGAGSWTITAIVDAWISGLDISPAALEKLGIEARGSRRHPLKELAREKFTEQRREREIPWREDDLRKAGARELARKYMPLLLSLREGAFKLSDELDPSLTDNVDRLHEEQIDAAHQRAVALRRAVDCILTIFEGESEEGRGG